MKTEKGLKRSSIIKYHFQKLKAKPQFHIHMRSIHAVTEMENCALIGIKVFNKTKGTLFHERGFEISLFSGARFMLGLGRRARVMNPPNA